MRVLVTGSRTWNHPAHIAYAMSVIAESNAEVTLVSGACPDGADRIAEQVAAVLGWKVERHPADWHKYGKRAGFVRNAEMVALGADMCLAFIRDESKGASMTAKLAEDAGIPTARLEWEPYPWEESDG